MVYHRHYLGLQIQENPFQVMSVNYVDSVQMLIIVLSHHCPNLEFKVSANVPILHTYFYKMW